MEPAKFLGESDGGGIQPMTPCVGCSGCLGCARCAGCAACECSAQNGYWTTAAAAVGFLGFGLW